MIAVVIPCYRVKKQVLDVIARIGPECDLVLVVDDGCPDGTGDHAGLVLLPDCAPADKRDQGLRRAVS